MEEYSTHHILIIRILAIRARFVSSVYMFQILNLRFQYTSIVFMYIQGAEIVQEHNI